MRKTTTDFARDLRQTQTDAEIRLWSKLRARRLGGYKFYRQRPIGPYIADFVCRTHFLVIELDGGQHTPERDAPRTAYLEREGYRVIRFWNPEVLQNTDGVLETILQILDDLREHSPRPNPLPRERE